MDAAKTKQSRIRLLFEYVNITLLLFAARSSIGDRGTKLQAGKSHFRVPIPPFNFFELHNPSGSSMGERFTEPLKEMNTTRYFCG
jgi:hypothetical protein